MYKKYLTFSYDDGPSQDIHLMELFDKYGMKGTFNLNTLSYGEKSYNEKGKVTLTFSQKDVDFIRNAYSNHEVATHSVTHPNLTMLSDEDVIWQIADDEKNLEYLCSYDVIGHAYPGGFFDDRVISLIRSHSEIKYARTVRDTLDFTPPENFLAWHPSIYSVNDAMFDLADKFLSATPTNDDLIFYIWGHSSEFSSEKEWERIERLLDKLAGKDDICYVTNAEYYNIRTK